LKKDEVFGPYKDGNLFKLSRMMDIDRGGSVKARHILIAYEGTQSSSSDVTRTKAQARTEAYRIQRLARAKDADFANLARTYSDGPSKSRGGDLGFFKRGDMVEAFNDFVFSKRIGTIGVVETAYGFHVIEVQEKEDVVLVASVVKKIVPSEETSNEIFRAAAEFEIETKRNGFTSSAESLSLTPKVAANLMLMDEGVPGLGAQRSIVKWTFSKETKLNEIKRFDLTNGGYVVAELTGKKDAGLSQVSDVEAGVRPLLLEQKKYELLYSKYSVDQSLSTLAEDYDQVINTSSALTASAGSIAGAGSEPYVVGVGFSLPMNSVSTIIEGKQGVFALEVDFIEEATPLLSYDGYTSNLSQITLSNLRLLIDEVIRDQYDVVDNRFDYF
jgi:peptidyl-prolyl cis-trans isomerase D